jgi:CheY-like chemotaxis protein
MHAITGAEAIARCRQNPGIDLIFMDIKLPDMDGYEVTREIRKFDPDIPIISLTAYAFEADREKALAAGCTEYLSKPVKKEGLMMCLRKYKKKKKAEPFLQEGFPENFPD